MPCLVLTGHPSVGKTSFATVLKERALQHKSNLIASVIIVNEESVCVDCTKSECYASSHAEKSTRSALKAKVDRSLQEKTLVICDSLNYIKGYRYELHCLSKAAKQQHGIVWILNSQAIDWNRIRQTEKPDQSFTDDQMRELIQRYEPPDSRNRWDKPLWRVDLSPASESTDETAQEALKQSVYNMHELSEAMNSGSSTLTAPVMPVNNKPTTSPLTKGAGFKRIRPSDRTPSVTNEENTTETNNANTVIELKEEEPKKTLEEQIDAILDEFLLNVAPLKEGLSTRQHVNAQSNVLHEVDSLTLQVCNALVASQAQNYGSFVTLTEFGEPINMSCRRQIPLTELKRLRKQYVRWVSKVPPDDTSHRGLVESFVQYVEAQVNK
jgi:protein KTI12